jgi:hypothetical protein
VRVCHRERRWLKPGKQRDEFAAIDRLSSREGAALVDAIDTVRDEVDVTIANAEVDVDRG